MLHTLWTVIGSTQEPTLSGSFDLKLKPVFSKNIFEINVLHSLSSSNSFTQWGLQVRRFKHLVYFCKILCLSKGAKHMIKKNSITRSTKVGYYQETYYYSHNYPELKVMRSNVLFCPTSSKPLFSLLHDKISKYILYTVGYNIKYNSKNQYLFKEKKEESL